MTPSAALVEHVVVAGLSLSVARLQARERVRVVCSFEASNRSPRSASRVSFLRKSPLSNFACFTVDAVLGIGVDDRRARRVVHELATISVSAIDLRSDSPGLPHCCTRRCMAASSERGAGLGLRRRDPGESYVRSDSGIWSSKLRGRVGEALERQAAGARVDFDQGQRRSPSDGGKWEPGTQD